MVISEFNICLIGGDCGGLHKGLHSHEVVVTRFSIVTLIIAHLVPSSCSGCCSFAHVVARIAAL